MDREKINNLILIVQREDFYFRCALFIWGVLLYALAFSLFFSPNNIVTGGSMGLSILVSQVISIDYSVFVFAFSLTFLIIGYFTLGRYNTFKTICGVMILPIFMKFTTIFTLLIDFSNVSLFLVTFLGGALMGLGNGVILRSGFSIGGFQTIYQILNKYWGISIGKATLVTNGVLVTISSFLFGISNFLYAIIALYVASLVTDRVLLETSLTKTFFIVTEKSDEISEYVTDILGHGATVFKARGGYSGDSKRIVMCSIPTRKYYEAKEIIEKLDDNAFFLITDTYEICGGT